MPRKKKPVLFLIVGIVGAMVISQVIIPLLNMRPQNVSIPGVFTLSSNAGSPDTDGSFTLSWTAADGAESYTVYEYSSFITEINTSVTSLGLTTTQSRLATGQTAGMHYFIVKATNAGGTKLSNCISVNSAWHAWTWISGAEYADQTGNYGIKGVPSPSSYPGARLAPVSWTGLDGSLWLFGGRNESGGASLNDLWRFNVTSNEWTWVNGSDSKDQNGVYGIKGETDILNTPGARYGSVSWVDLDGNLWLFGGYGLNETGSVGYLNDLWRFNVTSSEWTWVNGSNWVNQLGTYGIKGSPNAANTPGGRYYGVSWIGPNGKFWLFGGYGYYSSGGTAYLNDLWQFDPTLTTWTWVNGTDLGDQNGTYGEKGTPAPTNTPGGRYQGVSWVNNDNMLWLFGGYGWDSTGGWGDLNDLWCFDIISSQWTWKSGNETCNPYGNYEMFGIPSITVYPGARHGSISWIDVGNDLWLFGGYGYNASSIGYLNDLWRFNASSSEWTWVSGSPVLDQKGTYGSPSLPAPNNMPGARQTSTSWVGADNTLWLFGGTGYDSGGGFGRLNDLFRFYF